MNFSQTIDKVWLSPFSLILQDGLTFGQLHHTTNRWNPDSLVSSDGWNPCPLVELLLPVQRSELNQEIGRTYLSSGFLLWANRERNRHRSAIEKLSGVKLVWAQKRWECLVARIRTEIARLAPIEVVLFFDDVISAKKREHGCAPSRHRDLPRIAATSRSPQRLVKKKRGFNARRYRPRHSRLYCGWEHARSRSSGRFPHHQIGMCIPLRNLRLLRHHSCRNLTWIHKITRGYWLLCLYRFILSSINRKLTSSLRNRRDQYRISWLWLKNWFSFFFLFPSKSFY